MIKRLILLASVGMMLTGCFMAPMALIGPATSGWTSASIVQSGLTTTASYLVKKTTGKSIGQHAFDAIALDIDILQQSYSPNNTSPALIIAP